MIWTRSPRFKSTKVNLPWFNCSCVVLLQMTIELSRETVEELSEVAEFMDFKSEEEFILAAVGRLVDYYRHLMRSIEL